MGVEELFERLGVALTIGLLIGAERGWREREARDGARAAGIRTHTLVALLGAVWSLAAPGEFALGLGFLAFALTFGFFEWQETKAADSFSATGLVAGLLVFALGAYAARGSMTAAASAGVVATVVLAERQNLHLFLQRLTWAELRAALILLVMTFVLLPLLPDRPIDPWGALNPHQIWLMTILLAAISYGGYIAVRLAGGRNGLLFAGLAGGLVSSTTVTWTFARLARRHETAKLEVIAGILGSWVVSLIRMTAIAIVISLPLAPVLIIPVAAATLMLLVPAAIAYVRSPPDGLESELKLEDPFDFFAILRFGALIAVIMLVTGWIQQTAGATGLLTLGAVSGLADVDPITLSMAEQSGHALSYAEAASVILIAAAANGVAKCGLGFVFGTRQLAAILAGAAIVAATAAGLVLALVR